VRLGYTVSEVVHSYGIITESITEFAEKSDYVISSNEYKQLTSSLDSAVADAVTEFQRVQSEEKETRETERLGFLAHELRNSLQSALLAFEMIEDGRLGPNSNTGGVLQSSLQRMGTLIDNALTEVRMRIEPAIQLERIRLTEVMSEVGTTSGSLARKKGQTLRMQGSIDIEVEADRQLLVSAIANLVQNALKFSPNGGTIQVRSRVAGERVLIEVQDQCGGLPEGSPEDLFKPFVQRSSDRSGVGLGLTISRRAIELNKGKLRVENRKGEGCIFIVELPQALLDNAHINTGF
jgi:signal transduction histidine kinase